MVGYNLSKHVMHLNLNELVNTEEGLEWAIPKLGAIGIRAAHELHK